MVFESDASSAAFLNELCSQVLKKREGIPPDRSLSLCHHELMNKCGIDLEDVVKSDVDGAVVDRRLSSKFHGRVRAQNLTSCLEINFGIDENLVRAKKSYHRPSDVLYPRKTGSRFRPTPRPFSDPSHIPHKRRNQTSFIIFCSSFTHFTSNRKTKKLFEPKSGSSSLLTKANFFQPFNCSSD